MVEIQVISMDWAQNARASASPGRVFSSLGSVLLGKLSARDTLSRGRSDLPGSGPAYRSAAFRLRGDQLVSSAAIFMRLLASTAAPTHNSKRSRLRRDSASCRGLGTAPRCVPRCRRESAGLLECRAASRRLRVRGVFLPPRCGMHTSLTPACLHDAKFCSLKKPRSEPYSSGARPKACCGAGGKVPRGPRRPDFPSAPRIA